MEFELMTEIANAADRITHILGLSVQLDWGVWISALIVVLLGNEFGSRLMAGCCWVWWRYSSSRM
jgi:hypothetical protein